jgi:lycopene cyclase domain-containing protein
MKTEYFIVLGLVLVGPLLVTAVLRLQFYRNIKPLLQTISTVCLVYWTWDVIVTARGHWSFNPLYTVGWTFFGMPAEEWLFFVVIAFVSIFTLEATRAVLGRRK